MRKYIVTGRVQGVGFRYFARESALILGIKGYVKNCYNGTVEVVANGTEQALDLFEEKLKQGPSYSLVENIYTEIVETEGPFSSFKII